MSLSADVIRFAALVLGAACLFTVGGIFMKLSDGATRIAPSIVMAICFVAGAVLQALAMRGGDLGVVYVIVLGVEAVLAMAFGWFFFSEHMTPSKIGGAALIVAGIATLRAGL
jgi:multidrug transporter EmrE-like cation transporter